jgi:hypothetical protein
MNVIFIIGAPRSGTTLLAKLFDTTGNFAYLEEPNFIWKSAGNSENDEDEGRDLSLYKIQRIRQRIIQAAQLDGDDILLEKTPSNCLRLHLLLAIFPEGKFIFIKRRRLDVISSMEKKWTREDDSNSSLLYGKENHRIAHSQRMFKRFSMLKVSEWIGLIPRILSEVSFLIIGRRRRFWGVRYRGWSKDVENNLSIQDMCGKQYDACNEAMEQFLGSEYKAKVYTLDYEEILSKPFSKELDDFVGVVDFSSQLETSKNSVLVRQ